MADYSQDLLMGMQGAGNLRSNFAQASQGLVRQKRNQAAYQFLLQTDDYFSDPNVKAAAMEGLRSGLLDPGFISQVTRIKESREADKLAQQKYMFDRWLAMQNMDLKEREFALQEAKEQRLQVRLQHDRDVYGDERMDLIYDRARQRTLDAEKRMHDQWEQDLQERKYQNEVARLELDSKSDELARQKFMSDRDSEQLKLILDYLNPSSDRLLYESLARMYSKAGGLPQGFMNFSMATQQGLGLLKGESAPVDRPIIDMVMRRAVWKTMLRDRIATGQVPPGALLSIGRIAEGDVLGALSAFTPNQQRAFWTNLRKKDREEAMGYLAPTKEGEKLTNAGYEFMASQIIEHIAPGTGEGAWEFSDAARRLGFKTMPEYIESRSEAEMAGRTPSILDDVIGNFEFMEKIGTGQSEAERAMGFGQSEAGLQFPWSVYQFKSQPPENAPAVPKPGGGGYGPGRFGGYAPPRPSTGELEPGPTSIDPAIDPDMKLLFEEADRFSSSGW